MASVHSAAVKPSVRLWQCSPYHPSTILVPLIDYSIIPARRRKKTGHNFIGEILILFGGGCDPFFKYFDRFFISEIYLHKDKLQNSICTCKSFLYAFYYFKKILFIFAWNEKKNWYADDVFFIVFAVNE